MADMVVSVEDLRDYMDISFTPRQSKGAALVLTGLQSELEAIFLRPVTPTRTVQAVTISREQAGQRTSIDSFHGPMGIGAGGGSGGLSPFAQTLLGVVPESMVPQQSIPIFATNTPISSVASVTVNGQLLIVDQHYKVTNWGFELFGAQLNDNVVLDYVGGFDGANNPAIVLAILRAASRETQNLHDDVLGVKALETRDVAPLVTGFTEQEKKNLGSLARNIP
jgi:hypothetical protein